MFKIFKTAAALAALAAAAPAVAQPVSPITPAFDASRAGSVAESLVLCDLAAYLGSNPNQDATRIYVRRDNHWFEPLIPPYVSWGGNWYDEDLERAYRRYRTAGVVTPQQIYAAQDAYTRPMTRAFERASLRERRFLQEQSRFCESLADNARRLR